MFFNKQPMETDSANFELELACAKGRVFLAIGCSQNLFEAIIWLLCTVLQVL